MSHQATTVTTRVEDVTETHVGDGDSRRATESSSTPHVLTVRAQPRIEENNTQGRGGVTWSGDVVDNEHMGKKKSKKCCIYHKPRTFGEWSDSEDSDHECDNCSSH